METTSFRPEDLSLIDAILLSHTCHLDESGRQLFNDRYVFTTADDETKLSLRPAVCGMKPRERSGSAFKVRPLESRPYRASTHEVVKFIESFGEYTDDRFNSIYFSGGAVHMDELAQLTERLHTASYGVV
ncbi:hypothetical protein N7451_006457 [Penicillium sp. IBT 35674x]|nr:hypothetical protein N7451_006457 [Penicillium sp. IBT 35674x]